MVVLGYSILMRIFLCGTRTNVRRVCDKFVIGLAFFDGSG